jgi:hypothetical protein
MPTDFRIARVDDENPRSNVIIAPQTLTVFRQFLTEEELRTGLPLASQGYRQRLILPAFEVRARPFALSTFVRIFDYDEGMICLVEEAQFRGLCITVIPLPDGGASLSLSGTTDEQFVAEADTSSTTVRNELRRPGRGESARAARPPAAVPPFPVGPVRPHDRPRAGPVA